MPSPTRRSVVRAAALLPAAALLTPSSALAAARPSSASWSAVRAVTATVAGDRTSPARAARLYAHACVAGAEAAAALHPDGDAAAALAVELAADAVRRARLVDLAGPGAPRVERVATAAAAAVARRAAQDGADLPVPAPEPSTAPDRWQPLPGQQPLDLGAGSWLPWRSLPAGARPALSVAVGSDAERAAHAHVLAVSRALTPVQEAVAWHWADGPGTATPAGRWLLLAVQALEHDPRPLAVRWQVLAAVATAAADAFVACWRLKYREWTERPVTRVRRELAPDWEPLLPTPPFPGWVSGHATVSAACAEVLAADRPRDAARWRALAGQAADSRLYGGLHVAHDNADGALVGAAVGRETARRSPALDRSSSLGPAGGRS